MHFEDNILENETDEQVNYLENRMYFKKRGVNVYL